MTIKVEPIKNLVIDDVTYQVKDLGQTMQTLVLFYDDWREREANLRSELLMVQAGIRDIKREVLEAMKVEIAGRNQAPSDTMVIDSGVPKMPPNGAGGPVALEFPAVAANVALEPGLGLITEPTPE